MKVYSLDFSVATLAGKNNLDSIFPQGVSCGLTGDFQRS